MKLITLLLAMPLLAHAAPHKDLGRFLDALHWVEASGGTGPIKGDKGRSLGPLQISKAYWIDAKVAGRYEDCAGLAYSQKVAIAYFEKHCPAALEDGDWEKLARIHNGGPTGHRRNSTLAHWRKVKKEMDNE